MTHSASHNHAFQLEINYNSKGPDTERSRKNTSQPLWSLRKDMSD